MSWQKENLTKEELKNVKEITLITSECDELFSIDPLTTYLLMHHQKLKNKALKMDISIERFNIYSFLPRLVVDQKVISIPALLTGHIEELTDIDKNFDRKDLSRIYNYKKNCQIHLYPALLYQMWADNENAVVSAHHYTKGFYQPFRFLYIRMLRRKYNEILDYYDNTTHCTYEASREVILAEFKDFLSRMTLLLGEKQYILGEESSLDMYFCSYLAPIFYFKYPNNILRTIVEAQPTIKTYFTKYMNKYGIKDRIVTEGQKIELDDTSDRAPTLTLICAGLFTVSAMFGFAVMQGIVKIRN